MKNRKAAFVGGVLALAGVAGVATPGLIELTKDVNDAYRNPHLLQPDTSSSEQNTFGEIRQLILDFISRGGSIDEAIKDPAIGPFITSTIIGSGFTVSEAMHNPLYPLIATMFGVEVADNLDSGEPVEDLIDDPSCYSQNIQGSITDNCGAADVTPESIDDLSKYQN